MTTLLRISRNALVAAMLALVTLVTVLLWLPEHDPYGAVARCVESPIPDVCLPPAGVPQRLAP